MRSRNSNRDQTQCPRSTLRPRRVRRGGAGRVRRAHCDHDAAALMGARRFSVDAIKRSVQLGKEPLQRPKGLAQSIHSALLPGNALWVVGTERSLHGRTSKVLGQTRLSAGLAPGRSRVFEIPGAGKANLFGSVRRPWHQVQSMRSQSPARARASARTRRADHMYRFFRSLSHWIASFSKNRFALPSVCPSTDGEL